MDDTVQEETRPAVEEWDRSKFNVLLQIYSGAFVPPTDSPARYMGWHANLQAKFTLHPAVNLALDRWAPADYVKMSLEFPHVSETDPMRLAYTRSPMDGESDRQLVTSIGKYLARHWPHVSDHLRRDVQAFYTPDTLVIETTTPSIIRGVEEGPRSCMASVYNSIPFKQHHKDQMARWFANPEIVPEPDWELHPYSCYAPELGWSIALRRNSEGRIDGRALLLNFKQKNYFVRTYMRHRTDPINGWSEADFTLSAWLEYKGYMQLDSWPDGAPIQVSNDGSRIFAPYLDGSEKGVVFNPDGPSRICHTRREYTHWCEDTSGYVERGRNDDDDDDDDDNYRYCEDCDDRTHCDDTHWVGRHADRGVCSSCINSYTFVWAQPQLGVRDVQYYLDENIAEEVTNGATRGDSTYYIDPDYPPDNVICLEDGEWALLDDAVRINGDYYLTDDPSVVRLEEETADGDHYGLRDDCFEVTEGKGIGWWGDEEQYLEAYPAEETETEETS